MRLTALHVTLHIEVLIKKRGSEMSGVVFIDGQFVEPKDARMSIFDAGFVYSDTVFDVLSSWDGWIFKLDEHLARFSKSCDGFRLRNPYSTEEVRRIIAECVDRSGLTQSYIKLEVTRGVLPETSRDPRDAKQRFVAYALPYIWIWGEGPCRNGGNIHVSKSYKRIPLTAIDSRNKNYNRADFTQAKLDALDSGCHDAMLVSIDGALTEGSGWNVMVVKDGRVTTPDLNVLLGVTRETVNELCELEGIPFEPRRVDPRELYSADEVFAATTAGGIMPITSLDGSPVANGSPGKITRHLQDLYWAKRKEGWHGTRPAEVIAKTFS